MSRFRLQWVVRLLKAGGVVAYPTEAVYGIGCDPLNAAAFRRLLALKGRPEHKGTILIAADFEQLQPYVAPLPEAMRQRVAASWPGPVTWLLPVRPQVPPHVTGGRDKIAARVTDHPIAAALCRAFGGPLVSTSANLSGKSPARTALRTRFVLGDGLDYVVAGPTGGLARPTPIYDAVTGATIRA